MAYLRAFNSSRPNINEKKNNFRLMKVDADIFLNYRYRPLCVYCGGEYATYSIKGLENGAQKCKHCTDANEDADRDVFL